MNCYSPVSLVGLLSNLGQKFWGTRVGCMWRQVTCYSAIGLSIPIVVKLERIFQSSLLYLRREDISLGPHRLHVNAVNVLREASSYARVFHSISRASFSEILVCFSCNPHT